MADKIHTHTWPLFYVDGIDLSPATHPRPLTWSNGGPSEQGALTKPETDTRSAKHDKDKDGLLAKATANWLRATPFAQRKRFGFRLRFDQSGNGI